MPELVVLVGHSERRHVFGETNAETALKCAASVRNGLTPILCVGELLTQREAGETNDVVLKQLHAGLGTLTPDIVSSMAIAYEPVWAIGTGKTATPDDAASVHAVLRHALREVVGVASESIPILYGGSVSAANAAALLAATGVDGLLVGGASLDVESWLAICAEAGAHFCVIVAIAASRDADSSPAVRCEPVALSRGLLIAQLSAQRGL
jgi:triosephosphate isomerase